LENPMLGSDWKGSSINSKRFQLVPKISNS